MFDPTRVLREGLKMANFPRVFFSPISLYEVTKSASSLRCGYNYTVVLALIVRAQKVELVPTTSTPFSRVGNVIPFLY